MKKTAIKANDAATMDLDEIQRLIDLGETKGLAEFEVEKAGVRVRIKYNREAHVVQVSPGNSALNPMTANGNSAATPATPASIATPPAAPSEAENKNVFIVRSPIVGTFYSAPDPNSSPFVKVGDHVKVGQVLCIVEAMKLMNEIESEVSGELLKIYVENAQPVEYGESLFELKVS